MLDFKKLNNMPFEEAEKIVLAEGYKQDMSAPSASSECASGESEMILDSYYKKYDEEDEDKDSTISFVQLYNVLKHNEGDLDDIEVVRSYWEEVEA